MAIGGIDIGTTGCKCSVYSPNGRLISEAYREYTAVINEQSHTLDPVLVWESVKEVIEEACNISEDVTALAVTSFGESVVFLGDDDDVLTSSMLYTDPRGKEQCDRLTAELGDTSIINHTGLSPSPMYSISKILWLKENQPELYEKVSKICLFEDFIVYKLCGVHQIDYSLASRTMAFDINQYCWWGEMLQSCGIKETMLPVVVPIGTIAGNMMSSVVRELGLSNHIQIVSACHDQVAAAIGTGAIVKGSAVDGTGTVECITPVFDNQIDRSLLASGSYGIVPYIENQYVTYAFTMTAGAMLKWYRDELANLEAEAALKAGENPYDCFGKQLNDKGTSGLLVLPHFSGAATPYMDSESVGAILGLTTKTSRNQIYQALMEGAAYEMKLNMERLEEAGINIEILYATGGGAMSDIWMQIKADIWNKPLISFGAAQSGTLGSAMLAGVSCGSFVSLEEAMAVFVEKNKRFEPNLERHKIYMEYYEQYKKLYGGIKTIYGRTDI